MPVENIPPHNSERNPGSQFPNGQPASKINLRKIIHHATPINRKIPFASQNPATIFIFRRTRPSPAACAAIAVCTLGAAAPVINCFPHATQYRVPGSNGLPQPSQYMFLPPSTPPLPNTTFPIPKSSAPSPWPTPKLRRWFAAVASQTSSRSGPRFPRKKYAPAPITIAKKSTTPASIANAPGSTLAPATAPNRDDQIAAYPNESWSPALPAGIVVHGAKQHRKPIPIKNEKKVTLKRVFMATVYTQ